MPENNHKEIKQMEAQIQGLFDKCRVPETVPEQRIYDILLRVLHEISLVDLIQFVVIITQTMGLLVMGVLNTSKNGDKK